MRALERALAAAGQAAPATGLAILAEDPGTDPVEIDVPAAAPQAEVPALPTRPAPPPSEETRHPEPPSAARPEPPAPDSAPATHVLALLDAAVPHGETGEEDLESLEARERAEAALAALRDPTQASLLESIARTDSDPERRLLALDALAEVDPVAARRVCETMLRADPSPGARRAAAIEIALLAPGEEGREALRRTLLADPDASVRGASALVLARLEGARALPDLRQAAEVEDSASVRRTLASAIALADR